MDVVASLLSAPRARGAFVLRSDLAAPWSIRVEDRAPLTLLVVVRGTTRLLHDDGAAHLLGQGEVAVVRGPGAYRVCDEPATPWQALISVDQRCTKPDGSPLSDFRDLGVRAWGNVPEGRSPDAVLLTATYAHVHQVSRLVLDRLPAVLVVPPGQARCRTGQLVDLLLAETATASAAQDVVLDRLVDLVLVSALRTWLDGLEDPPPWYAARGDAVVAEALRRLHHEPHRPWALASLASDVGVSRATLARRFSDAVGEPPMAYLTRWRLGLAADLIATTDLPLEAVAARVGYASAYSLSGAFRRAFGRSPSTWRQTTPG